MPKVLPQGTRLRYSMPMRGLQPSAIVAALGLTLGCGGAGRFGYSRSYIPLGDERTWIERAQTDAVYDEVRRMPEQYQGRTLAFFGVVRTVGAVERGVVRVTLEIRTHQERHLCEDETDRSCRVTVSARDGGPFTALVTLRDDDLDGENRVQVFSLLRVFGTLVPGAYDDQGGPVVRAEFYRHWPRGEYVTTDAASQMRR
jgi:hypothetical protein